MMQLDQVSIVAGVLAALYILEYFAVYLAFALENIRLSAEARDRTARPLGIHAQGRVWILARTDSEAADILLEMSEVES